MTPVFEQNEIRRIEKMAINIERLNPSPTGAMDYVLWCIEETHKELQHPIIDSAFIESQLDLSKNFKWKKNKFRSSIALKKGSYDSFSIPIFLSPEKNSFLIFHDECCAIDSGGGTCQLFRKVNGKWTLISKFLTWIS